MSNSLLVKWRFVLFSKYKEEKNIDANRGWERFVSVYKSHLKRRLKKSTLSTKYNAISVPTLQTCVLATKTRILERKAQK